MPKYKATGQRGSWFATVDCESLPRVHSHWLRKGLYHDPNAAPGTAQWNEHFAAIRDGQRVILTRPKAADEVAGFGFDRKDYVAVFSVADVEITGIDLKFRHVERLTELE